MHGGEDAQSMHLLAPAIAAASQLHPSGGCANTQHPNRIPLAFSWLPGVDLVANGWARFLLDFVFSVGVFVGPLGMRIPIGMLHPKAPSQHPNA